MQCDKSLTVGNVPNKLHIRHTSLLQMRLAWRSEQRNLARVYSKSDAI
jgi:hypothetical protein